MRKTTLAETKPAPVAVAPEPEPRVTTDWLPAARDAVAALETWRKTDGRSFLYSGASARNPTPRARGEGVVLAERLAIDFENLARRLRGIVA